MAQPPVCFDCDKEIPFTRYRLGLCPECEEERAMTDPNWHRSSENHDSYDPDTYCRCGHRLDKHEPTDLAPCEECECEEFNVEPDGPTLNELASGSSDAWTGGIAENH